MVKRYPLNYLAVKELAEDLKSLEKGLNTIPQNIASAAVKHAENYFNGYMSTASPGRQAVINASSALVDTEKGKATGRLTATGETKHNEYGDFNILMAVEFGAGIAGIDGLSNPEYPDLPYGTGTFPNQKHAFDYSGWLYPTGEFDENGKEIYKRTRGTPATMPMHHTIQDIKAEMPRLVEEEIRKWLS